MDKLRVGLSKSPNSSTVLSYSPRASARRYSSFLSDAPLGSHRFCRESRGLIFGAKDRALGGRAREMLYPRFGRAIKFRGIKVKYEISRVPSQGGAPRRRRRGPHQAGSRDGSAGVSITVRAVGRFLEKIRCPLSHLQTGIHGRTSSRAGAALKGCARSANRQEAAGNGSRAASLVARNSTRAFLEFPAARAVPGIQILHARISMETTAAAWVGKGKMTASSSSSRARPRNPRRLDFFQTRPGRRERACVCAEPSMVHSIFILVESYS